jgi:hypothetical protein
MMFEEMHRRATTTTTTTTEKTFTLPTLLATAFLSPNQTLQYTTTFEEEKADIFQHNRTTGVTTSRSHSINKNTTQGVRLLSYQCTLPNGKQVSLPPVPRFIIIGAQKGT